MQQSGGLAALTAYSQFILWQAVPLAGGKTTKIPVRANGQKIDPHQPANWLSYAVALEQSNQTGYGIGFVFTENDPFFVIDIDDCVQGTQPNLLFSDVANNLGGMFQGAAVEVSQSGKGIHIIGTGQVPEHRKKRADMGLEFYTEARFIALTFNVLGGDAALDCTPALQVLARDIMAPVISDSQVEWTTGPRADWHGPVEDNELIERFLASKSAGAMLTGRATLRDLWEGNEDKLAITYPSSNTLTTYDHSNADAALAAHLAFWTGGDCERIERLMRRSALVREKWDRRDYFEATIAKACALTQSVYNDIASKPEDRPPREVQPVDLQATSPNVTAPVELKGYQFLTGTQQAEYFAGCVYVTDLHKVLTPGGELLRPDPFKARYGGYEFSLDTENQKATRNAFEAFTQSQAVRHPKVDSTVFRPDMQPGQIMHQDGRSFVNIYVDIQTPRRQGDPSPFLNHLAALLPDPGDQMILLSYMAALVQYKGVKFDWCPLLQGTQGNGKTFFTRCVKFAIGDRYSHMPKASKIDNQFNAWMLQTIFCGVEDVYFPHSRQDIIETLKPMITGGDGLEIEGKGVDQDTHHICVNFILNSNHKDALRLTRDDRRFAIFYTRQQTVDDLLRDGLTEAYFESLYTWANNGGYEIINEYLHTFPLADQLNPAKSLRRAPKTTSTEAALVESQGPAEQEVQEAIESGRAGFCGGWVSSVALDRLLDDTGFSRKLTRNKRAEMLEGMGYVEHPGLPKGRTNNATATDLGRVKLWIKRDSLLGQIQGAAEIAKRYDKDQEPGQTNDTAVIEAFKKTEK